MTASCGNWTQPASSTICTNSDRYRFAAKDYIPNGNPLVAGGGGLVTAASLLIIVAIVYGVLKRPSKMANATSQLSPRR